MPISHCRPQQWSRGVFAACALSVLAAASGCSVRDLGTSDRLARGLVVVLPGIEGRSAFNVSICRGLDDGGVDCAIEIFDWNAPTPFLPLANLAALDRNREQAAKLAKRVIAYQGDYPGRPVHLVGHSGGAGIAVFAMERLTPAQAVSGAVLLAPALSPEYNLAKALQRSDHGIFSFYSKRDVLLLGLGTTIAGTMDRNSGPSAGAVAFEAPHSNASRSLYKDKLYQVAWSPRMARAGNSGSHLGWTDREFVQTYLAPLIMQQQTGRFPEGAWQRLAERARGRVAKD